ncbi:hypothetical protein WMF38_57805 [Sorangium sp. So ce118]
MSRPPILFLDVDGVLNSRRFFADRYSGASPDGMNWEESQIDPAAVAILNQVIAPRSPKASPKPTRAD